MVDKKKKKEQPCVKCIKKAIEQINAKKKKAKKKTKPALKKTMPLQFVFPHSVTSPIPVASIPVAPSLKVTSETQTVRPKFASFETQTDRPKFASFETQTDRPTFSSFETQTDRPKFASFETQTDRPTFSSFETQTDIMGERGVPVKPTFSSFETQTDIPTFDSIETQTDIEQKRQRKTKEEKNAELREKYFQKYGFYPPENTPNEALDKALQKKGKPIFKDIK